VVELVSRKPDLCVSGVSSDANIGTSITASGTVGAAMEAADEGVPAQAAGLETTKKYHHHHSDEADSTTAAYSARQSAGNTLRAALPSDVHLLKRIFPVMHRRRPPDASHGSRASATTLPVQAADANPLRKGGWATTL
jgi:5'/3'-nucleotidase SurE